MYFVNKNNLWGVIVPWRRFVNWIRKIFSRRRVIRLGLYGPPNAGKTTLANKIAIDWTGEPVGRVSEVPHETREVQKKERVVVQVGNKKLIMNLLDMPGIATKIDYEEFMKYGLSKKEAQKRAKEATRGVIEAIKWLENVDTALVVMDSTKDPYTQVNITIIGNLEARDIPVIIVANKIDLKDAKPELIREAFPQHPVVEISGLTGKNIDLLYEAIAKYSR
ncbi:MAG: GTP-binding protein [Candidatus Altiarchaeales archaeon]|nr:MAG: GTP-binding protein [Candidatus Altiarchaeales archaeon]RLI93642.1 MAG: GTP-binding protein [Candidatus Altiarchaeales archaeon]HDO81863.1 GTP-binding protein [Candidatus Altiarchaeales archaeon]HEX54512.1 GTP-binding protein [Candidatus Altiarchaeales archaeon]